MAAEADTVTLESSTDLPLNDTSINFVCLPLEKRSPRISIERESGSIREREISSIESL